MEVNENNLEIRKKQAILKQKLDLINISISASKNLATKKSWEGQRNIALSQLQDMDDALCRTEIITKFDLMEFE